jgi:uncharacterized membrane protein YuzA (DUF378 family)
MKKIVLALLVIGALNWGLVGLGWLMGGADWNVVHLILGKWMKIEAIVYVLVGLAGVYKLVMLGKCGGCCKSNDCCKDGGCCQPK